MSQQRERIVVGCMTGTSLDGLDAAVVRITGSGLEMKAELLGHRPHPMPPQLRSALMQMASGEPAEPLAFLRAARGIGEMHAQAVEQLLHQYDVKETDFVVAHGQTIWHAPRDDSESGGPKSWQLFDPWPVVKRIGTPVCYDLRQADLIAGGEGAPLTPLSDWVMYRGRGDLIVNLGGVFNYTSCPLEAKNIDAIEGCDVCLCNLLLDGLSQRLLNQPYDMDGAVASTGQFDETLLRNFEKRLEVHGPGEGSLGRENLQGRVIDQIIEAHRDRSPADLLFNAIVFIAQAMRKVFESYAAQRLVLAGGGTLNKTLVQYTREIIEHDSVGGSVLLSEDLGIPSEAREAMGFAVLGALSQDGVSISLPQVTGTKSPGIAGVWAGAKIGKSD